MKFTKTDLPALDTFTIYGWGWRCNLQDQVVSARTIKKFIAAGFLESMKFERFADEKTPEVDRHLYRLTPEGEAFKEKYKEIIPEIRFLRDKRNLRLNNPQFMARLELAKQRWAKLIQDNPETWG